MAEKEAETAVTIREDSPLGRIVITEAQVDLIKKTVALNATDDELKLFFYQCRRYGVHPLDKLVHFVKRGTGSDAKVAFQAGIDFMRSQAEATGEYRGQDDIEYSPNMLEIKEGDRTFAAPEWAKSTVHRKDMQTGEVYNISATAFWTEYYPGEKMGFMWRKMPRVMLGKCAESQALRKAFPRHLAGLYSDEEMEQADVIDVTAKPPITPPQAKKAEAKPAGQAQTDASGPKASDKQVNAIYAMYGKLGTKDKDEVKIAVSEHLGLNEVPEHLHDLTKAEASSVIEMLNKELAN